MNFWVSAKRHSDRRATNSTLFNGPTMIPSGDGVARFGRRVARYPKATRVIHNAASQSTIRIDGTSFSSTFTSHTNEVRQPANRSHR